MKDSQKISVITDFLKFVYRELGIKHAPKIRLTADKEYPRTHTSFGGYSPHHKELTVYIGNRNTADLLRTLAHELVHHKQHEINPIDHHDGKTGSKIENQANSVAGILLRKYGMMNPLIFESINLGISNDDTANYQIYCDMDGVLCDFNGQFDHYFGNDVESYRKEKGDVAFMNAMKEAGEEFWYTMPWTNGGKQLWSQIGKYGVIILSAPGKFPGAAEGKKRWISENLSPKPESMIFTVKTKFKHLILADKSPEEVEKCVLIDDYDKNLIPWVESGGKGVHFDGSTGISKIIH